MKKTVSLYLLLLLPGFLLAQSIRFGFTTSPTFSSNNIDPSNAVLADGISFLEDSDSKFGFQYGVMADLDINDEERYFFNTGIVMHHTGYNVSTRGGMLAEETDYEVNTQYLEIPTTLKLKTNEIGFLKYYGQFGVNHGIRVGNKITAPDNADESIIDPSSYNAALNVGGGVEYTISDETALVGGVFYNNGFSKVLDDVRGSLKQNQLGIRIGVFF